MLLRLLLLLSLHLRWRWRFLERLLALLLSSLGCMSLLLSNRTRTSRGSLPPRSSHRLLHSTTLLLLCLLLLLTCLASVVTLLCKQLAE